MNDRFKGDMPDPAPDEAVVAKLREAFTDAELNDTAVEPVPSETIWQALDGDLSPERSEALADRLVHDPILRQEWRLAMELHRSGQHADASTGIEARPLERAVHDQADPTAAEVISMPTPRLPRRVLPLAAAIAMMGIVAVLVVRFQGASGPGSDTGAVMRSGSDPSPRLEAASDLPTCTSEGCSLRWEGIDSARRYEVDVTTEDLEPVYSRRDLVENSTSLPASVLSTLEPPKTLLWQVTAHLESGETVRSATHRIEFELLESAPQSAPLGDDSL